MKFFSHFGGRFLRSSSEQRMRSAARKLQAAPLSPRRLEPRRVLDAGAAEVVMGTLGDVWTCEFVQAGENAAAAENDTVDSNAATLGDQAPTNVQLFLGADEILAHDTFHLAVTFDDPNDSDAHTAVIDWGDGTPPESFVIEPGARSFGTSHQYLDENPSATPASENAIQVTILDRAGNSTMVSAPLTASAAGPTIENLTTTSPIEEGQTATLRGTLSNTDPSKTYQLDIDWDGDNDYEQTLSLSSSSFEVVRFYPDDNPTGTLEDTFTIHLRLRDADKILDTASVPQTVRDASPSNLQIDPISAIDENGLATIRVTFEDVGLQDTHFARINWGDGSPLERIDLTPGAREVVATHQYLDDNPTGTSSDFYRINVGIINDDGGRQRIISQVLVNNVAPVLTVAADQTVDAGAVLDLTGGGLGSFTDVGTRDTYSATVDWGDGSAAEVAVVTESGGVGTLAGSHAYADGGLYTVTVTVTDDDGGVDRETFEVTVQELTIDTLAITSPIDEGETATVTGTFTAENVGDLVELDIDWNGDGAFDETVEVTDGVFQVSRQFPDDDPTGTPSDTVEVQLRMRAGSHMTDTEHLPLTVRNVAPVLTVAGSQVVDEGSLLDLTGGQLGSLTDVGVLDTHTASVNWGDGTPAEMLTIDPSNGKLGGSHVYADNGTYTVTVSVVDDDTGVDVKTFQVQVNNVDPSLAGIDPVPTVDEGAMFSLAGLGVTLTDPGFDNPNNPLITGGSQETLTALSVDWGDGTPAEAISVVNRVSGGPGVLTTADFENTQHTYADNGLYTVTILVADDDGGTVARTFQIEVQNVAPTLVLTTRDLEIDEGDTLDLYDLGQFFDPGFNNPLNTGDPSNGGEVEETFSYTIDWGDGTVDTGQLPATLITGQPGVETFGTLANSHQYIDNDLDAVADNLYTITVTLSDDDGGTATQQIIVRVNNINPALIPITATDVNTRGETTLTLEFDDPGTEIVTVWVDWGDKLTLPAADRFVPETFVLGPGTQRLVLTHTYNGPPNPASPASDIVISVFVRDDDFGEPVLGPGQSETQMVAISNPGTGVTPIAIDTTPQVPRLVFPRVDESIFLVGSTDNGVETSQSSDLRTAVGDTKSTTERYLELRVIDPATGEEGAGYRLKSEVLRDLPALFRTLPDNHYAIYLVRTETNTRRLVIEVYVRNGKLIDPGDDSEGTRDRPPTNETIEQPRDQQPDAPQVPPDAEPEKFPEPAPVTDAALDAAAVRWFSDRQLSRFQGSMSLGTLAVGLAASAAGRSWSERIDRAVAIADDRQWRLLRLRRGRGRPDDRKNN